MSDHINVRQGITAPSSIESVSSGTSVALSTDLTMPVPSQVLQAPPLLKARSSAPGAKNFAPQTGQTSDFSAATSSVGPTMWPFGHLWVARRENMSRIVLSSSVPVPKVLRMPGTPGL